MENSPPGFHCKNRIMLIRTTILPVTGEPVACCRTWSAVPMLKAEQTVPTMLPTPPTTTVIKLSTI